MIRLAPVLGAVGLALLSGTARARLSDHAVRRQIIQESIAD